LILRGAPGQQVAGAEHARSHLPNFRLKDFSDSNLKSFNATGDKMVAVYNTKDKLELSKKMKPLDNPQECVEAAYNYAAMHGQFHPIDWSPKALLKTMLHKMFDQYVRLFEKFISENRGRAQKNGVPLTYMEIVGLWNTFIAPSPINMGARGQGDRHQDEAVHEGQRSTPQSQSRQLP
jgi:hypothetical protein